MFSNLIGHTRALLPQGNSNDHIGTDLGDFDQTPPPSSRTSVDMSRSEDMGSKAIKGLRTNHETVSLDYRKSPLDDPEVTSANKPTPLAKSRQFEPAAEPTNILGALPVPLYHETSISQNGATVQHSRLEYSAGDQNDHESEDIPGTTGALRADNDLKSSRGDIGPRPTLEQNSPRPKSILSNKD
ncbi:uncharacterized protein BKA55DRAFT_725970 [Fusarium redolens]|jgi:hypothetical protein|uniref:Uncharacterized protein n=1 Tax=Fusarium redolens TaxID=48865 RepID=A0A9P9HEM8_FUSRE|nr:uncharacterized protein BKA55DRAFT_725970 [Fusarium redolens]KAH7255692.1 hypothetical protein BKA55DRAFT_725970 [Fusarium redolens]